MLDNTGMRESSEINHVIQSYDHRLYMIYRLRLIDHGHMTIYSLGDIAEHKMKVVVLLLAFLAYSTASPVSLQSISKFKTVEWTSLLEAKHRNGLGDIWSNCCKLTWSPANTLYHGQPPQTLSLIHI